MSAKARELRERARSCLELAETTNEHDAKSALVELAHNLIREARQAERREEHFPKNG
jgi:hypothetical protein